MQLFYFTLTLSVYLMVAKMLQALDGQQVSRLPMSSKNPVTPTVLLIILVHSLKASSVLNAGQILAIVVFTEAMNTI